MRPCKNWLRYLLINFTTEKCSKLCLKPTEITSIPTTVTMATVATFPINKTKSPTELMAATLSALFSITPKAWRAALQNP